MQLGLWLESERMLHPVINQIGVDTQNEVVKEEKRLRIDNQPYGNIFTAVKKELFKKHPYRWATIGSMEHLDAATLQEFLDFNKKFYVPNNAVLVVAGDFETDQAKKWINQYFGSIKRGEPVLRRGFIEEEITTQINATYEDPNIQLPMVIEAYRTPSMRTRDARVLDMISSYLSGGKSSVLYKKLVDKDKIALEVGAFNQSQEDYGMYIIYGIPLTGKTSDEVVKEIDKEIAKLQNDLISERDFQKLQNVFENRFVNSINDIEGIADNLATYYALYGNISLINNEIDIYRSITREDIREVALKYLKPNQRVIIDYVPTQNKVQQ